MKLHGSKQGHRSADTWFAFVLTFLSRSADEEVMQGVRLRRWEMMTIACQVTHLEHTSRFHTAAPRPSRQSSDSVRAAVFDEVVPEVARHNPAGLLLVATNPVDLLTAELPRWLNLGYRSIRLFVSGAGGDVGGGGGAENGDR